MSRRLKKRCACCGVTRHRRDTIYRLVGYVGRPSKRATFIRACKIGVLRR